MRTIAITNQRVGIGTTVTVQSVAVALSERGQRVLTDNLMSYHKEVLADPLQQFCGAGGSQ